MIQLGPEALAETYPLINSDYNLSRPKPTGNGEPWYELYVGATAYDMRRSAYWTFMAGGAYYTLLLDLGIDPDARVRVDDVDDMAFTWGMPL